MADPGFRAHAVEADGEVILRVAGEVDMLSAPNFIAAIGLRAAMESGSSSTLPG